MAGKKKQYRSVSTYSITNLGFQITALGDIGTVGDTIVRTDARHKQYERFFIRNGLLQGAILINRFSDKAHLGRLIETKTSIEDYKQKLRDMNFDIRKIEPNG